MLTKPKGYERAIELLADCKAVTDPKKYGVETNAYLEALLTASNAMIFAGATEDEAYEWADSAIGEAQTRIGK